MPIWLVRATWTADEASNRITLKRGSAEAADEARARDLLPGEVRRLPQ
ncbi:MAG TPA: hypothetical protein VMW15_01640 [Terracidiphilus sp.]|nr:hypothetical protein [Terracidiphilus sp.]